MSKPHRTAKATSQKPRRRSRPSQGYRSREVPSAEAWGQRDDLVASQEALGPDTWAARRMLRLGAGEELPLPGVDEHAEGYRAWMDTQVGPDEDAREAEAKTDGLWRGVRVIMATAVILGLGPDPAGWSLADLDVLTDHLSQIGEGDAVDGSDSLDGSFTPTMLMTFTLSTYVSFLGETGRWHGSKAAWTTAMARLGLDALPQDLREQMTTGLRAGADVDADTAAEALTALPLVTDLVELLGVVASGALQGEGATEDPAGTLTHPAVTVAARTGDDGDVLAAAHLVLAACACGVVVALDDDEPGDDITSVRLAEAGRRVLASPRGAMDDVRDFVAAWLMACARYPVVLTADPQLQDAMGTVAVEVVMPLLARGLTDDPVTPRQLTDLVRAVTRDVPKARRRQVQDLLRGAVARLVRAGVLDLPDGRYVVPRGLETTVIDAAGLLAPDDEPMKLAADGF